MAADLPTREEMEGMTKELWELHPEAAQGIAYAMEGAHFGLSNVSINHVLLNGWEIFLDIGLNYPEYGKKLFDYLVAANFGDPEEHRMKRTLEIQNMQEARYQFE